MSEHESDMLIRQLNDAQDRIRDFIILLQAAKMLTSGMEVPEIYSTVKNIFAEPFTASTAVLWRKDPVTRRLEILEYKGLDHDSVSAMVKDSRLRRKIHACLRRESLQIGRPDSKFQVHVPLFYGSRLRMVISMGKKLSGNAYDKRDLGLLETLSLFAAIALNNAQSMYREHQINHELVLKNEELQKTRDALVLAERQAAIADVVAGLAHEVRNPLNIINGFAHRIDKTMSRGKHGDRIRNYLGGMTGEISRLDRIIRQVYILASASSPAEQELDLHEFVKNAVDSVHDDVNPDNVRCVVGNGVGKVRMNVDPRRLATALLQIMRNALQHSPEGSCVHVDFTMGDESVKISLRDSGPGIQVRPMERIFEPFYTTKDIWDNLGLGLAIAKRIVEDHGGNLSVSNIPGSGACITMALPVRLSAAASS